MRKGSGKIIIATAIIAMLTGQVACNRTGSGAGAKAPSAAELARIQKAGPLQMAREASALEFWLHYKLMKATGMEAALGGEDRAVATLKAISLDFEHGAGVAQTEVPRLVKTAFDGTGLDAGVLGTGYGLIGGAITSGINGGMTNEQIAEAAKNGPVKLDGDDGSAQVDVTQGGMDSNLELTVNENGVTGKVKTHVHIDACPDAQGKLVVTIETQSQMSAGAMSGAVTVRYRQERFLDDDAHLIPIGDDGSMGEDFQMQMDGTGASGNALHFSERSGFTPEGTSLSSPPEESGHSIFRPEESAHTEALRDGTLNVMRAFSQIMLDGSLFGAKGAPWESGRCVDLQVRSDPAQRTSGKPNTAYTLTAEPRAKLDGAPTGGTVKGTLNGENKLNPTNKVKADARFDYSNPTQKDRSATIDFEARSKRGVGKATLTFDTKKGRYRIEAVSSDGTCAEPYIADDITKPFTNTICGGKATWTHTPTSDKGGLFTFKYADGSGTVDTSGTYTLTGPEDQMTATYNLGKICGHAHGMTACAPGRQVWGTRWTRLKDGE